jgi:hypothetical protein
MNRHRTLLTQDTFFFEIFSYLQNTLLDFQVYDYGFYRVLYDGRSNQRDQADEYPLEPSNDAQTKPKRQIARKPLARIDRCGLHKPPTDVIAIHA